MGNLRGSLADASRGDTEGEKLLRCDAEDVDRGGEPTGPKSGGGEEIPSVPDNLIGLEGIEVGRRECRFLGSGVDSRDVSSRALVLDSRFDSWVGTAVDAESGALADRTILESKSVSLRVGAGAAGTGIPFEIDIGGLVDVARIRVGAVDPVNSELRPWLFTRNEADKLLCGLVPFPLSPFALPSFCTTEVWAAFLFRRSILML